MIKTFKNKLNFFLVNLALICVIIYLIYTSRNLWLIVLKTLYKIFIPFLTAFFIAYIFYPILKYLIKKRIPKAVGIIIILLTLILIIFLISIIIFPQLFSQITSLISYIITFINHITSKYNFNILDLEKYLYDIIKYLGEYVSNSAINIINYSINYIIQTLIITTLSIYFLNDMDKIRTFIKDHIGSYRTINCVKAIDQEMNKYFLAFFQIMIISFFEYTIIYKIIGHPNAIILGILVAIFGIIPYIGGIITNIIAGITAFSIGPNLFIKTLISFMILSIIDGYIINPLIYNKSNKIPPLIIIFSVIAGSKLGGIVGMIISIPLTIIIITYIKFHISNMNYLAQKIKKSIKLN